MMTENVWEVVSEIKAGKMPGFDLFPAECFMNRSVTELE